MEVTEAARGEEPELRRATYFAKLILVLLAMLLVMLLADLLVEKALENH